MPLSDLSFSLDQARVFVVAADEGSFTAAARALGRAQSAVSFVIASLERALGVVLFERGARGLALTPAGQRLLPEARNLVTAAKGFSRLAGDLAVGNELEVVVAIDVLFPLPRVTRAVAAFSERFPHVDTRLHVEPLGGVAQLVLDRSCALGIIGSLPDFPDDLIGEPFEDVDIVAVAAPTHPLASLEHWPNRVLSAHCQLVVTDRTRLSEGRDFAVFADRTLRTSDLAAKHAMLLEGLGWGAMPMHLVASDLAEGRLVRIYPDQWGGAPLRLPFQLIRHGAAPVGPAASYFAELLRAGHATPPSASR